MIAGEDGTSLRRYASLAASALLIAGGMALVPTATASVGAARPDGVDRATWVWGRPRARSLVAFAVERSVDDLFVSVPDDLPRSGELAWFRNLRTRTAAAGVGVHALGSETSWVDDPQAALAWQSAALGTGLFDGVHLDVEPWLHDRWDSDRAAVVHGYLGLLEAMNTATSRRFEVDIAFWLDQVETEEGRLDEAVLARVDAVTVLSYRNTVLGSDSITGVAANALAAAARADKPARLAVETNFLGTDPVSLKQTFHGASRSDLAAALAAVDSAMASSPAYRGVAVHDFSGWAALRARER